METRKTVQAILDGLQRGDLEQVSSMLAERFRFRGRVAGAMDAKAWLGMCASLKAAFPNLDYRFEIVEQHEGVIVLSARLSGTHTGDLDLTDIMDIGVIPATYKSFRAEPQTAEITVDQGRVSAWVEEPAEGAGLLAILQLLDVYIADAIIPHSIRQLDNAQRTSASF